MRYRLHACWAPLLCLGLFALVTLSRAEVSVNLVGDQPGTLPSGVLSIVDEPGVWPQRWTPVRSHIDAALMLNADGDAREDGEPDFVLNLDANAVEVVWALWDGSDYEIVHSSWSGSGWSEPEFLTSNQVDDLEPKLAVAEAGSIQVTWWRESVESEIFFSSRAGSGGGFGQETPISNSGDSCMRPTIATRGATTYIAYETSEDGYKTVTVEASEGGGPFLPEVIASTTRPDDLEVGVHVEGQVVWTVWIDSDTHLGWSERGGSGWSSPSYEPYAGQADLDRARLRIKRLATR